MNEYRDVNNLQSEQTVEVGGTYNGQGGQGGGEVEVPEGKVLLTVYGKQASNNPHITVGPKLYDAGSSIDVEVTVSGWGFSASYQADWEDEQGQTESVNSNDIVTRTVNFTLPDSGAHTITFVSSWGVDNLKRIAVVPEGEDPSTASTANAASRRSLRLAPRPIAAKVAFTYPSLEDTWRRSASGTRRRTTTTRSRPSR